MARGLLRMEKVLVSFWGGRKRMVLADPRREIGGMLLPKVMMDCAQVRRWMNADLQGEEAGSHCCARRWRC